MFIDIHAHAYGNQPPLWVQFCTPEQLIERYDKAGIEKGVLLPIVSPEIYLPQSNEDILGMAQKYPDRFIPFCNIDPRALTNSADAPLDILLRYYKDQGCKGLGEVMLNVPVMDPMVQNLFRHAQDVGLPVTFDGSDRVGGDFGLYDDPGLPQLEHTLQKFPRLKILGHGSGRRSDGWRPRPKGRPCSVQSVTWGTSPHTISRSDGVRKVRSRRKGSCQNFSAGIQTFMETCPTALHATHCPGIRITALNSLRSSRTVSCSARTSASLKCRSQ